MKLNAKISIAGLPLNNAGGGATSWDDLTGKPFDTLSDDFVVDNGELKLAESGGSVEIDNKSLIEVDGKIQEAVPLYSENEEVTKTINSAVFLDREQSYKPEWYYSPVEFSMGVDITDCVVNFTYNGINTTWEHFNITSPQTLTDSEGNTWTTTSNLEYEDADTGRSGYYLKFTLVGGTNEQGNVSAEFVDSTSGVINFNQEILLDNKWNGYNINMLLHNAETYPIIPRVYFSYYCGNSYDLYMVSASANDVDVSQPVSITDDNGVIWTLTVTPNADPSKGPRISLSTQNLPSDFQYFDTVLDEISQQYGNLGFEYPSKVAETVVHQLPAEYVPIDNNTIQNINGKLVAQSSSSVSNVEYEDLTGGQGQQIGTLRVTNGQGVAETYVYAPAGGGSVDIDNQSIVENQQGQIETAVKLYKEDVTTTYNAIKGWTPNGRYIQAQNNPYAIYLRGALTNTGSALYTIIVNFDFENQNYQLSGVCNQIGSMLPNNFLWGDILQHFDGFGVSNSTVNSAQLYTHAYSGTAYTINWVVVKEADYNVTYSDTDQDVVEAVYHKVPVDYIPVDNIIQEDSNGNLSLAHNFLVDMINVGTGLGSNTLNAYKYPNYKGVTISLLQNPSLRATIASQGLRPVVGGAHSGAAGGSASQNALQFTRTNSVNIIQSVNNTILNNYANSYVWIGLYYNYTGMNNPDYGQNAPYQIIGRMHVGDITNDKTDFTIEGCEGVLESAIYDSSISKYVFTFKQDIYPALAHDVWYLSQTQYKPLNDKYQKINSFFLPLDNNTIKRDSDGNITTAIPAPPTTDGNYTLAVTVTNGIPTYSWV